MVREIDLLIEDVACVNNERSNLDDLYYLIAYNLLYNWIVYLYLKKKWWKIFLKYTYG